MFRKQKYFVFFFRKNFILFCGKKKLVIIPNTFKYISKNEKTIKFISSTKKKEKEEKD
jgi:hypothetical protein